MILNYSGNCGREDLPLRYGRGAEALGAYLLQQKEGEEQALLSRAGQAKTHTPRTHVHEN